MNDEAQSVMKWAGRVSILETREQKACYCVTCVNQKAGLFKDMTDTWIPLPGNKIL